jgi:hypothetical protein
VGKKRRARPSPRQRNEKSQAAVDVLYPDSFANGPRAQDR